MERVRMTRDERRAETREAVLAAAAVQFRANGYAGTSIDEVAEAAGYSKGAVYSNFASKEDLFLEVVTGNARHYQAQLAAALAAAETLEAKLAAFEEWVAVGLAEGSDWAALEMEFGLLARKDPEQFARLQARHLAYRDLLAAEFESYVGEMGFDLVLSPSQLADVFIMLVSGATLSRTLDPDLSSATVGLAASLLFARKPAPDADAQDV